MLLTGATTPRHTQASCRLFCLLLLLLPLEEASPQQVASRPQLGPGRPGNWSRALPELHAFFCIVFTYTSGEHFSRSHISLLAFLFFLLGLIQRAGLASYYDWDGLLICGPLFICRVLCRFYVYTPTSTGVEAYDYYFLVSWQREKRPSTISILLSLGLFHVFMPVRHTFVELATLLYPNVEHALAASDLLCAQREWMR